ncbi:hypothetical protein A2697_02580 [Candidatus Curtissbacteria bacterium RIFCSPHIGHO2_01_FULL_41_44]|uniref:Uncharacterized protein n=1 Tax=Candidatus Curtissbacteria bacterium RIFCSPLOWO2_01_FULL_42_50 TaxID=1797730 RepID=A0A1F5H292_9BACT|nr:MAG: hypothetical protein A2697_02580 [Candidatus Curtissbacteria bacterium RIFCSPHIGHO2_01_FULL_41_44]OGD92864.1 MAG: hypothetical protein A3C33_02095 [Candidatus Curtissbacteria bacterium RIFCSPHIGHO2_02_FULL_42_58]OGD96581.1 MAG: hypothetical protein A3E71_02745 [Candidatus Curtissbacteria bacterium RIFCSPHIGHO2_12_FULL_42_33]OGD98282.1 MAG: hypothetical protein A3B54_04185 [Candidatus Curtissbacteria bacterium RIFCSPLOWO2_01_FULL_42_50]OGE03455.1 MAG: hypothetical protein A3G16_02530 [Ca
MFSCFTIETPVFKVLNLASQDVLPRRVAGSASFAKGKRDDPARNVFSCFTIETPVFKVLNLASQDVLPRRFVIFYQIFTIQVSKQKLMNLLLLNFLSPSTSLRVLIPMSLRLFRA